MERLGVRVKGGKSALTGFKFVFRISDVCLWALDLILSMWSGGGCPYLWVKKRYANTCNGRTYMILILIVDAPA